MQILFLVLKKLSLAESECLCQCVFQPALFEANSLTWTTCIVHLVVAACIVLCKDREKSAGDENIEEMMLKSLKR